MNHAKTALSYKRTKAVFQPLFQPQNVCPKSSHTSQSELLRSGALRFFALRFAIETGAIICGIVVK